MTRLRRLLANPWLRWLIPLILLVVLLAMFRDQLPFLGEGLRRLAGAHPGGVALTVIAAVLSLLAMAEVMRLLMHAGGVGVPRRETGAITLASNSWSTTLPGGPAFSAILTFQIQRSWGASVLLCSWFFALSSAISTMWLVLIGFAAVIFLGATVNIWSLLVTFLATLALTWSVYWITGRPRLLERWVRTLLPHLNRLLRRDPGSGLTAALRQVRQLDTVRLSGGRFLLVATHSLLNRVLDIMALWACVWAVTGVLPGLTAVPDHTTLMGVVLAYVTAKLAGSAQVTPAGLGTVEAAIIATLVATGMTAVDATGVAIVYRLISFALITIVGWVIYFLHYARRGTRPRDFADQAGGAAGTEPVLEGVTAEGLDSPVSEHPREGKQ